MPALWQHWGNRHLAHLTSCFQWAWWPCWSWNVGGRPLTRLSNGWRCPFCRVIATSVSVKPWGPSVHIQFDLLLMQPSGSYEPMTLTEDQSSVEKFFFVPTSAKNKTRKKKKTILWAVLEERHSLTVALICNIEQCGSESWLASLQTSKSSNTTTRSFSSFSAQKRCRENFWASGAAKT